MPHDLSAAAAANVGKRRADAAARVATDPSGRLVAFRTLAEASAFSTNVSADKIIAFDETGEVLHARAFHTHQRGGDAAAGEAEFAAGQVSAKAPGGAWLLPRQAFEDLWNAGRRILYGAVNGGNMGTEGRYGPFCLIADPEEPAAESLGVFPADTAQSYADAAGNVDEVGVLADVAPWSERASVVLIERDAAALAAATDQDWPDIICQPKQYLEVCRIGELPRDAVATVRLRPAFRENLRKQWGRLAAKDSAQEPSDRQLGRAYAAIRRWPAKIDTVKP